MTDRTASSTQLHTRKPSQVALILDPATISCPTRCTRASSGRRLLDKLTDGARTSSGELTRAEEYCGLHRTDISTDPQTESDFGEKDEDCSGTVHLQCESSPVEDMSPLSS